MGIGEGDNDNIFDVHGVEDDVGETFHDALPQIGGNQFSAQWKVHDAGYTGLKLSGQSLCQFRLYGPVVM